MDDLIAKLEAAESGSRALDGEVLRALGYVYHMDFGSGWYARPGDSKRVYGDGASQVTTSLDAALSLASRVLEKPYVWVGMNRGAPIVAKWSCELVTGDDYATPSIETDAQTGPLALTIAILRATRDKSNG